MTKQLTPWHRVVLEKLIIAKAAKKFLPFHDTRKFIAVFTRARQWFLSLSR